MAAVRRKRKERNPTEADEAVTIVISQKIGMGDPFGRHGLRSIRRKDQGMISLKDFISDTLTQIAEGVVAAQENTSSMEGARINPRILIGRELPVEGMAISQFGRVNDSASIIHFDVAVTVSSEKGVSGGGGAEAKGFIGVISGKANLSVEKHSETAKNEESRIQFSIPVVLPQTHHKQSPE